jgi:hypothetical protein
MVAVVEEVGTATWVKMTGPGGRLSVAARLTTVWSHPVTDAL